MEPQTILVVDDDRDIINVLAFHLGQDGFAVVSALTGAEALHILSHQAIDLVILDIMLPGMDGIEVCRRIRENNKIPVILLSARSTDVDKVIGLSIGADDYLVKPFSPIELIARVKAQLRRANYFNQPALELPPDTIRIHGLEIHEASRSISVYGNPIKLTKTEYEILLLLAKHPNRVFSLEEIYESVWQERCYAGNNTVMVHLARLREKIGDTKSATKIIQNLWGMGYKIEK